MSTYYDALRDLSESAADLAFAIDEQRIDPEGWNHKQFAAAIATARTLRLQLDELGRVSLPPPRADDLPSRPIMGVGERGHGWTA